MPGRPRPSDKDMTYPLEFRRVSREFQVRKGLLDLRGMTLRAVDDVSLHVEKGETLGLVGESGCGKSTLARMAVGLLAPSAGEVLIDAAPLASFIPRERARRIQMVFQDPFSSLNPRLSVGTSVAEPLRMTRPELSSADLREQVLAMLEKVELRPEQADLFPHEFSGGQRQRVAVARALVADPSLVVCDEPVSALDASVQAQVLNLLRDMQDERGLSYLFISHDLSVVGFMSRQIAVMYLGHIVELASRDELFSHPAHPYSRALLAAAPGKGGTPLTGEMPSPFAPPRGCAFHPRCPIARELCREKSPEEQASGGHIVRCHFPL